MGNEQSLLTVLRMEPNDMLNEFATRETENQYGEDDGRCIKNPAGYRETPLCLGAMVMEM